MPEKPGSCHLICHSAATLMLEGGADIRYIYETPTGWQLQALGRSLAPWAAPGTLRGAQEAL